MGVLALVVMTAALAAAAAAAEYNVVGYGARPGGREDSAPAFLAECNDTGRSAPVVCVLAGTFLVSRCGPGHGISIGSLGGNAAGEAPVRNVTVEGAALTGTQNGMRIKTWGRPSRGLVAGVSFARVTMRGVRNPAVVDQNYCPSNVNCPGESSGVKISGVEYADIEGTSATPVAVRFDCSGSNPCTRITLKNINLTYEGKPAQSFCKYAHGLAAGVVRPPSCLSS